MIDTETLKKHFNLLGRKGVDKVTGYKGVIDSVSFDLYGCVQVSLRPPVQKDGSLVPGSWFDLPRVKVKEGEPVMTQPDFYDPRLTDGSKGAAPKEDHLKERK